MIFIDSVYIKYKNYYPQVLEKKHVVRRKRDIEIYSDDSNDSDDSSKKTTQYTIFFLKKKQECNDKFTFLKTIRKVLPQNTTEVFSKLSNYYFFFASLQMDEQVLL